MTFSNVAKKVLLSDVTNRPAWQQQLFSWHSFFCHVKSESLLRSKTLLQIIASTWVYEDEFSFKKDIADILSYTADDVKWNLSFC
jgi:hypothetical protein